MPEVCQRIGRKAILPSNITHRRDIGLESKATNVGILASGLGTNGANLITALKGHPTLEVCILVSDNPQAPALAKAEKLGVSSLAIPFSPDHRSAFEDRLWEVLREREVHWVCLAGFMRILSKEFLAKFYDEKLKTNRVLNVHPSLLPEFPGRHAYQEAFNRSVRQSGVTIHFVEEQVDRGPIILQRRFNRHPEDDLNSFIKKGKELEHKLYPQALALVAGGKVKRKRK